MYSSRITPAIHCTKFTTHCHLASGTSSVPPAVLCSSRSSNLLVTWQITKLKMQRVGFDSQSANNLGGMPGVPAMHVSTSCLLENEAGMTATTLLGEASQKVIEQTCS